MTDGATLTGLLGDAYGIAGARLRPLDGVSSRDTTFSVSRERFLDVGGLYDPQPAA